MNDYATLAEFYDRLTTDVNYAARADYLLGLFAHHGGRRPQTLLDLGCGSGSLTLELARQGVDVIGADISEEMLAVAGEKLRENGLSALLLHQDMRTLDLYGTVEGAVCCLDALNHLDGTQDIRDTFRRLHLFIEPGGLLIFDVNTPYKHRTVLGDNSFVFEEDGLICVWRNRLIDRTCAADIALDFFVEGEDGRYDRLEDHVRERAYSEATLRRLLTETGFEWLATYGDMTRKPPAPEEQRWIFVARRIP